MHHVEIGRPELCVTERTGHLADDAKAMALPQPHGGGVAGDDGIELHRGEAGLSRLFQRVFA